MIYKLSLGKLLGNLSMLSVYVSQRSFVVPKPQFPLLQFFLVPLFQSLKNYFSQFGKYLHGGNFSRCFIHFLFA